MNKLLLDFENLKIYDDEIFEFLNYPNVDKYKYVISSYGRLFSFISLKEKKTHLDKDGYIMTSISVKNGNTKKSKIVGMHRLVAFTFLGYDPERLLVNHKDGVKTNNHISNLEWSTPKENTQHAILNGLQCNSGINCPSAIYSEETVRKICQMFEDGFDNYEIYKEITGHNKVTDKAIYALIFSIKNGTRHREISSEYDIPNVVKSKLKPKFSKEDTILINKLILEGYRTIDIVKYFGGINCHDPIGKRICDKVRNQKYKLKLL